MNTCQVSGHLLRKITVVGQDCHVEGDSFLVCETIPSGMDGPLECQAKQYHCARGTWKMDVDGRFVCHSTEPRPSPKGDPDDYDIILAHLLDGPETSEAVPAEGGSVATTLRR